MPRVDVEKEIAHIKDPFSQRQARIMWEFHNEMWYEMTLTGDLRRLWNRCRTWWRGSKPS